MAIRSIDLNSDLGEGCGNDDAMLAIVSSANVACGGHAGDRGTMRKTIARAMERGVVVGAHPSYPDREGFGRRRIACRPSDIAGYVRGQVESLIGEASRLGGSVRYLKPHGALGNDAAADRAIADAVLEGLQGLDRDLAVLAISGTQLERAARERGIAAYPEIYADRAYADDGTLVPRAMPGAVIEDTQRAISRLAAYLESGKMPSATGATLPLPAASICVHGDNAHAVEMASTLRAMLLAAGVAIRPFL